MKPSHHVRLLSQEGDCLSSSHVSPSYQRLAAPLRQAILRTREWLLGEQHPEGYWEGELEGDTILESEYILMLAFLGRADSEDAAKAARYIQQKQLPDGGWTTYPGGGVDISVSVKAYFAMKLTGHDPGADYMQRARGAILAHGGADAVNSFTRFYLALLGQISYDQCPSVPPEVMLLPKWFPVNLYAVSSWSRTIIVPLSIVSARKPVKKLDDRFAIRELFIEQPENWPPLRCPGLKGGTGPFSWDRFFRMVDRGFKLAERFRLLPLRERAIERAVAWVTRRFEGSDGLGAIFPSMVWSIVALKSLGHGDDSPELAYCYEHLDGLKIEQADTIRLQPCKSPVWDTSITLRALLESGVEPNHPAIRRTVEWLLPRQISRPGDWAETVAAEPGGWCFEHNNDFYPDVDDTAMVAMALARRFSDYTMPVDSLPPGLRLLAETTVGGLDEARAEVSAVDRSTAAIARAEKWILAMQNRDGGWGAFDRDNDSEFLCYVPFADHNAMIDPSTPDLTGRVLESLGALGRRVGDPAVDRAIEYLRRTREADGSWFGRWGVNYVYGTSLVLGGLSAVGVPKDDPLMVAGANWLLAYQQASGGWGESADSYADRSKRGQGPETASQTAWAVLGLISAGLHAHPAVARGIRFLLDRQRPEGTWDEPEFTGTGFPQVFYLRYHLYRVYFPLMALSRWAVALGTSLDEVENEASREPMNATTVV